MLRLTLDLSSSYNNRKDQLYFNLINLNQLKIYRNNLVKFAKVICALVWMKN